MVFSKKEITKMINEARLDELNWRENGYVDSFKKVLKKMADSDKELSLFCQYYGVNTNDDNYLIVASYLYSIAKNSDPKMVYLFSKRLNDYLVKTCCTNLCDIILHKELFDQAEKILNNLSFGNKFVACNLWKILTNKNYKPIQDTQMPPQIKNTHLFNGEMLVNGEKIENECKYTPWSLLWILTKKERQATNEAVKNNRKKTNKKFFNNSNATQQNGGLKLLDDTQIGDINNIIRRLSIIDQNVKNIERSHEQLKKEEWIKLDEQVKEILDVALEKYIPYLGQAAKTIFVYPNKIRYDDNNDYDALDQEGKKWDSEKVGIGDDDLEAALDKMASEYGIGEKFGLGKFDWAKWLERLGSGIGNALKG